MHALIILLTGAETFPVNETKYDKLKKNKSKAMRVRNLVLYQLSVFSLPQGNVFEAAISAIKARLDERDSNIRKSWLLTE